ncbi:MAG: hypothetical protein DMG06_07930 [Acidobacteria bacterium]|nr:MAG: hypothetical protein DMG06_07930 [Acidobacteriota bacterium]
MVALDATVGPTVTARLGLRQAAGCSKALSSQCTRKGCSSCSRIAAAGEERSKVIKDPIGGDITQCVDY